MGKFFPCGFVPSARKFCPMLPPLRSEFLLHHHHFYNHNHQHHHHHHLHHNHHCYQHYDHHHSHRLIKIMTRPLASYPEGLLHFLFHNKKYQNHHHHHHHQHQHLHHHHHHHHHNGKRKPVASSSEKKAILSYGGQAKGDAAQKPDLRYNQS